MDKSLKNKRIITVATTGAWPKKENNPNVPLQPEEISEEIYQCWKIVQQLHTFMYVTKKETIP